MESRKTIVYIGGFELPDKNAAAQRVIANGKILRTLGFNVVYVGIDKTLQPNFNILDTKKNHFGFESWSISYPSSKFEWIKHLTSIRQLKLLFIYYGYENLKAIICYNYPAIAQLKVQSLCRRNKVACVADATEWYGSSGAGFLFKLIKWLDTTLRMRYVHSRADGIITTSNFLSDFYKSSGKPIVELPTLYDKELLDVIPKISRTNHNDIIYFTYAGSPFNASRAKNEKRSIKERMDLVIKLMFSLCQQNIKFELNIYGVTNEDYCGVYLEDISKLEIMKDCVNFHGRKSHAEILTSIKSSNFTVYFRDIDRVTIAGFPSKFAESISCGIPVITNRTSNIDSYIKASEIGVFVELDEEEKWLREISVVLMRGGSAIHKLQQNCEQYVGFDYRTYVSQVGHFFERVTLK